MAFFDLHKHLTLDASFRNKIERAQKKYQQAYKARQVTASREYLADFMRLCHCNPGLLVPHFFPSYPKNKPLSLSSRTFTYAMMGVTPSSSIVFQGSRQVGKCVAGDTKLTTKRADGAVQQETIKNLFDNAKASYQAL